MTFLIYKKQKSHPSSRASSASSAGSLQGDVLGAETHRKRIGRVLRMACPGREGEGGVAKPDLGWKSVGAGGRAARRGRPCVLPPVFFFFFKLVCANGYIYYS